MIQAEYNYEEKHLELMLKDAYDDIEKYKRSITKLNRFIVERGLAEEYIAWIVANRITTGEE